MATKAVVQPAAAEIAQIVHGNSGSDHVERPRPLKTKTLEIGWLHVLPVKLKTVDENCLNDLHR